MAGDGTVERAFEIAKSGECRSIDEIRSRLKSEGWPSVMAHLDSITLKKQLRLLINDRCTEYDRDQASR